MINKFTIARSPQWYLAFPDVARAGADALVCVFSECTHHGDRSHSCVMLAHSGDRGRSWSAATPLSEPLDQADDGGFWNCPRISRLADGRLAVVCDRVVGHGEHSLADQQTNWLWLGDPTGHEWSGPIATPAEGIVPDRLIELRCGDHAGRWLLCTHTRDTRVTRHARDTDNADGSASEALRSVQRLWWSDDRGRSWQGPVRVAGSARYFFCEASIVELPGGTLACFLRENSALGYDAFKTLSTDGGLTWSEPAAFPLPGCHRPTAGLLADGRVLITHRFMQGGAGWLGWWTQNLFAGLTDVESCLVAERQAAHVRVLPLDFDRSPASDTGYSGWVQFDDGEIYVVNYIVDDNHPRAQIRGYSLSLDEFYIYVPQMHETSAP